MTEISGSELYTFRIIFGNFSLNGISECTTNLVGRITERIAVSPHLGKILSDSLGLKLINDDGLLEKILVTEPSTKQPTATREGNAGSMGLEGPLEALFT